MLETDAPDLPPAGHQGERNEPARLAQVAETLAELRGVSREQIARLTTANAMAILDLDNLAGMG